MEDEAAPTEKTKLIQCYFGCLASHTVPTPVTLRRMLSQVPTLIAARRLHLYWFRFGHTRFWVWALSWPD